MWSYWERFRELLKGFGHLIPTGPGVDAAGGCRSRRVALGHRFLWTESVLCRICSFPPVCFVLSNKRPSKNLFYLFSGKKEIKFFVFCFFYLETTCFWSRFAHSLGAPLQSQRRFREAPGVRGSLPGSRLSQASPCPGAGPAVSGLPWKTGIIPPVPVQKGAWPSFFSVRGAALRRRGSRSLRGLLPLQPPSPPPAAPAPRPGSYLQ